MEKGTLITADNLQRVAANLGINRAELLTRYRLTDPAEVVVPAEDIGEATYFERSRSSAEVMVQPTKIVVEDLVKGCAEAAGGRTPAVTLLHAVC